MKEFYGIMTLGMAALMAATPVVNTTTVKAADTSNSAITQSNDDNFYLLMEQTTRADRMSSSGNYNYEQREALLYLEEILGKDGTAEQNLKHANQLKAYLDKGKIGYAVTSYDAILGQDINTGFTNVSVDEPSEYIFDSVNKPQKQQIVMNGYTVLDKQGNPSSDGMVSMWVDDDFKLHVDPNYANYDHGYNNIKVLKNGDTNPTTKTNTTWTSNKSVVTTSHLAYLYTAQGKAVNDRALSAHSAWFTDRYATINGEKMYRVSTDEWVSSNDVE